MERMKPRVVLVAEDPERVLVYLSDGNIKEYPKGCDLSKLKERLCDPDGIIDLHLKSRQKRGDNKMASYVVGENVKNKLRKRGYGVIIE